MITHLERTPVFVIGQARSGTSILTKMIRKHLQIAFGTESQFIIRLGRRISSFGDLTVTSNRRKFVQSLATERFFARTRKNYGYAIDVDGVVAASTVGTYRSILDAVFSELAVHMGFTRWGDKTPEYARHLPELYALYPDARYINVIRDGRDVALSTFEEHFGAKNVHVAAQQWRESLEAVELFRTVHPAARVLDVRYEDLLAQPERTFRSLIDFLAIDGSGGLAARIGAAVSTELLPGNSCKWKTRLNPSEQRRFEAVAGALLERNGYERVATDVAQPSGIECLYWKADDLVRRARTDGYWRDSLYRLGLRLGPVGRPLRSFGNPRAAR